MQAVPPNNVKPATGQYGEVVARLQQIVESLEAGELSLEASLERFGEGVGLVKAGEKLLTDAEKRIEQLLSEEGRTAPLKISESTANEGPSAPSARPAGPPQPATQQTRKPAPPSPPPPGDDDVPF